MIKRRIFLFTLLATSVSSIFAAKGLDVERQNLSILSNITTKEIKREIDPHQITHIRLQQTYEGLRVWNGDIIVHIPKGETTLLTKTTRATLSGHVYQNLSNDLLTFAKKTPTMNREPMAMDVALKATNVTENNIQNKKSERIVYVDQNGKAHYAYLISFFVKQAHELPKIPTFIIDAQTLTIYEQWDNLQTQAADGGGFGGNLKMGQLIYDGLNTHLPKFTIDRTTSQCFLRNSDVTVKDVRQNDAVMTYSCTTPNAEHNNVYWSADFDTANGAYSPGNDALYAGQVIKQMYQQWYGIPVLTDDNGPMMLNMRVHEDMENAYWDGSQMTFGDGGSTFYPLVSLGVGAHEISHGFTEQHANLTYRGQSGGLNESFSDMAAMAAEFYSTGASSWKIGAEIAKPDIALRYMDEPTKDCGGREPGHACSISNVSDYRLGLNVHYSSGVYNKAFYLLATTPGWDTRKAFDVMVEANRFYWTANVSFNKAGCGVLAATQALHYSISDANNALLAVGVDTSHC